MNFTNFSIRNYSKQDLIVKLDYLQLKPFIIESNENIWHLLKNFSLIEKKPGINFESEYLDLKNLIEKNFIDTIVLKKNQIIALIKFLNTIGFKMELNLNIDYEVEQNYDDNFPGFYVGAFCSAYECTDSRMRFFKKIEIPFIEILSVEG